MKKTGKVLFFLSYMQRFCISMVLFCSKNIINNKIKEIDMSKRLFVMMSMCIMGLFTANSLFAEDVTVDGVNYTIAKKTQTAEVKGTTNTGKIVIPSELLVDDVTYIVTSVADEAFYYNTQIKDITLPSSIQKIGNKAFCHCSHLSNIAIPQTVNYIGFNAFEFCQSLRSIEFPDSMQYVPYMAFYGCMSLREVKLPNTLISIGSGAFRDCESLTEIVIPDSVTTFGDGVFLDCPNLKSVNIPSRVKKLSNSLFGRCSSLKEIEIPDSVAIIDDCAFYECTSLDSININKATQINQYAFYGCSGLSSVRFGEPLEYLGYMSFANCADLCDVYSCSHKVPKILRGSNHNPFQDSMIEETILHVPGSLIEDYKATFPWNQFGCIVVLEGTDGIEAIHKPNLHIQSVGGIVNIAGIEGVGKVEFYSLDGKALGTSFAINGNVSFASTPGTVVIARIGRESIKIAVK